MIYLRLFWEFFKTGLFAVGGGMATLPFLKNIGLSTGWYSQTDLMNMLAVSESTPGPVGINMLAKFRESRLVSNALYGLRPASSGLIAAACIDVALQVLLHIGSTTADGALLKEFASFGSRNWRGLVLAAVLIVFTNFVKPTKKWHPIIFIGISAVVGIVFHFGGV